MPCVYGLYSCGSIYYVGQTENLRKRLQQHTTGLWLGDGKWFDCVRVIYVEDRDERFRIEKEMIYKLRPPGNRQKIRSRSVRAVTLP
jgi:predicted GIY-YIG superfamily endonuclease